MRHRDLWALTGTAALALSALGARRFLADRHAARIEADLFALPGRPPLFTEADLDGLAEPARRYLLHALIPGTPRWTAARLWMEGTMTPTPGSSATTLTAVETLAPHSGFVWTAHARMNGLPVRVRDHYFEEGGGIEVVALGTVPIPLGHGPGVARSSRGRLVAEAVWCPTALVGPAVQWEAVDADCARFTLTVDGEPVVVTLHVAPDGALREVTLDRWGDADGEPWRLIPYGFRVEAERTFNGVTIPTRLTGGWHYGTARFDPATAAAFTIHRVAFATTR